jgi:AcrR family transcriptional regulator
MSGSETARRIALAARRLLEEEGVGAVSMRRVARAVGVTPMAIHRHYQNRAALLDALAEEGFAELAASLRGRRLVGNAETQLLEVAEVFLDHALATPRLFELMFLTPREGARRYPQDFKARRSPTATLAADIVARGMANGAVRKDDPGEIVLETGAMAHGLIMLYLAGRVDLAPEEFRALYLRAFRRYAHGILV